MNKTVAIHFEEDYLIAGVEPLAGKFFNLTKRGVSQFHLYFFVDEINNRIDYSKTYQENFFNKELNYFGNLLNILHSKTFVLNTYENDCIELLNPVMSDLRQVYFSIMRSILKESEIDETLPIPLKISYSAAIQKESQAHLETFFKRSNFEVIESKQEFPLLFVKDFFRKNSIDFNNKKIAFIEAIGSDLNMYILNFYNQFESEIAIKESFTNFGLDPRNFILAKKIVDDINKQEGLIGTQEDLKQEYLRQLPLAKKWIERLETFTNPYLRIETNFAIETAKKHTINISVEELNQLTFSHIRQMGRYFESHFLVQNNLQTTQFDTIILLGDALCNALVKTEFERFGRNKVVFLNSSEISLVLRSLLYIEPVHLVNNHNATKQNEQLHEIEFLNVDNLTIGQTVMLTNFDPAPGKGQAIQKFTYLGDKKFLVIYSTRSLQKGEIAEPLADIWVPGMQVDLKISLEGKTRGLFKTRKIVKIEVS